MFMKPLKDNTNDWKYIVWKRYCILRKRLFFQKEMKLIVTMLPFGIFLKRFFMALSLWDMSFFFFITTNISVDHKKAKKGHKKSNFGPIYLLDLQGSIMVQSTLLL